MLYLLIDVSATPCSMRVVVLFVVSCLRCIGDIFCFDARYINTRC